MGRRSILDREKEHLDGEEEHSRWEVGKEEHSRWGGGKEEHSIQ